MTLISTIFTTFRCNDNEWGIFNLIVFEGTKNVPYCIHDNKNNNNNILKYLLIDWKIITYFPQIFFEKLSSQHKRKNIGNVFTLNKMNNTWRWICAVHSCVRKTSLLFAYLCFLHVSVSILQSASESDRESIGNK